MMRLAYDKVAGYHDYVRHPDGDRLATDGVLESAATSELFSDAQAGPNERIPDGSGNRRGWWMDDFDEDGHLQGSRIWLRYDALVTPTLLRKLKKDAEDTYADWVTRGLISRVVADVSIITLDIVGIQIRMYSPEDPSDLILDEWNRVVIIRG